MLEREGRKRRGIMADLYKHVNLILEIVGEGLQNISTQKKEKQVLREAEASSKLTVIMDGHALGRTDGQRHL